MNAFFRRYLALATKEVQQLRRNRGLLVQLLLPPTLVLVIFGFALNPKVRNLRLGIVDESLTYESRDFINSLTENVNFNVANVFTRPEDAEAALNNLDLDLFLVIPTNFARDLRKGETADVQVIIDAVDANTAQIAQGYLGKALEDYNASASVTPVIYYPSRRSLNRSAHAAPPPGAVDVRSVYLYNPGLITTWYYVTGIMAIIMFITA
jgi:ABC-2 type transport system permease protein